jgi:hypothetical protein
LINGRDKDLDLPKVFLHNQEKDGSKRGGRTKLAKFENLLQALNSGIAPGMMLNQSEKLYAKKC